MISNSSCGLVPFIEWILKSESVMEYRIGAVRTLQFYLRRAYRKVLEIRHEWGFVFILLGLEDRRGIENCLKIVL